MKRNQIPVLPLLFAVAAFSVNCVSSGVSRPTSLTNVDLKEDNFKIVATGVSGEASSGMVLGLAMPAGFMTQAIGLFHVSGERDLQKAALDNLWKSVEEKVGPVKGKNYTLINVTHDGSAANWLLFYAKQTVVIRADVVEFTGKGR